MKKICEIIVLIGQLIITSVFLGLYVQFIKGVIDGYIDKKIDDAKNKKDD